MSTSFRACAKQPRETIMASYISQSLSPDRAYPMAIYGTAILSGCLLAGICLGRLLGLLMGIDKNVGGVGIAMLLLIFVCDRMQKRGVLPPASEKGIVFWSLIYIPIVVAMAASQNVVAALSGGPLALCAAFMVVMFCFAMVPLLNLGGRGDSQRKLKEFSPDSPTKKRRR